MKIEVSGLATDPSSGIFNIIGIFIIKPKGMKEKRALVGLEHSKFPPKFLKI